MERRGEGDCKKRGWRGEEKGTEREGEGKKRRWRGEEKGTERGGKGNGKGEWRERGKGVM